MKGDLDSKFRQYDPNNTGIIKKKDFINVVLENIRTIQPNDLFNLLNLFTTSFDDVINYDDFLKVLYKFGDMPFNNMASINTHSHPFHQDYSPMRDSVLQEYEPNVLTKRMGEALLAKLQPKEKAIVERIKSSIKGQQIEETLRRLARDNSD